jgi:putative restriction endonuclease
MVSSDPEDDAWRSAAFKHVSLLLAGTTVLSREAINTPFFLGGERATLVDPQRGIHKPRVMRHLLSVTTVMPAKGRRIWYADQTSVHREIYAGEAGVLYSFMGSDPDAPQNRWLREAAGLKIPIIYFVGIKPGLYQPAFPAFVTDWDPSRLNVRIVFTPALGAINKAAFPADSEDRRYAMRLVKQRLHQAQFREAVIDAYKGRCAISGLPEPRLLDAAHIIADPNEELGQPIVPNGLPLSKIHHAAFDANLIGIDADGIVHLSEGLLEMHDGPLLEHGLKGMAGRCIIAPAREEDCPDKQRLDLRFQAFKRAA